MTVYSNPAGFLLSGTVASGATGPAMNLRAAAAYGYLVYAVPGASAVVTLRAAHDSSGWMPVMTITATTTTGTAQLSGYMPYFGAQVNMIFSGGGATGYPAVFYAPGLI
jgi:hypothetical protein